jgi:peptide/nickel transport system substrate-binding protein
MKTRPALTGSAAIVAIAAIALAGCSPSSDGSTVELFDPADLVLATDPGSNPVDKVTWGLFTEPDTIDPVRAGNDPAYITIGNMCDTLLRVQPDFSIEPGLATSAEWVDELTFVIELRDDVEFWDGVPLTSADVAYSMRRQADPESQSVNTSAYESVESITATGDHEVTVAFVTPDSQFRNSLAGPAGYVFQQAFTETVGEEAIGTASGGIMCTGPFELEAWTPGDSITMVANDAYWDGAPLVKELELSIITSDSTITSALLAGDLDGAFDVPSASADNFLASDVGTLFVGPSTASMSFGPTTAEGPAADPRVREALDLVIDKEAFVKAVLNGYGAPQRTFTPPFAWEGLEASAIYGAAYEELPDNTNADLERAQQLIEEADLDDTELVLAIVAGEEQSLQSATIIQAAAAQLGLTIEISQLPGPEFGELFYIDEAREGIDFVATTGYLDTPGVLLYASYFAQTDGLFNWSEYDNSEADALLAQARTETDPTKSAEYFTQSQALFAPDRLQVSLASQYTRVFLNDELTGVTTSFAYIASPWALHLGAK